MADAPAPKRVSIDDVRHVAMLARLGLTDEHARELAKDLNTILEHMDVLSQVDTTGVDEADLSKGKISWLSPVAQAMLKARVDDSVQLRAPSGVEEIEIVAIRYG